MDTTEINRKIADATTNRDSAHLAYMAALHAGTNASPYWVALGKANQILGSLKDERHRIITGFEPWAGIKARATESNTPEELRTPDAQTFDLGHWELTHLCRILDGAIADDAANGLSGECARRLRQMVTTDGTVSITVRHQPK